MTDKKQQVASMPPQERKVVLERANSRDIVQTILQYGVSQQQIVYIIKLLSLELENMQLVQKISELIDSTLDDGTDSLNEEKATKPKAKIYT
jgi:hypothetical protein